MRKARVTGETVVADRYRLREVVAREPGRVCWYAEDTVRMRPRLLTRHPADGTGDEGAAEYITRVAEAVFLAAPRRTARLVEVVVEKDALWTAVEWIDGLPLSELAARQRTFTPFTAARIGLHVLDTLEDVHAAGVVHGDLGPGQVCHWLCPGRPPPASRPGRRRWRCSAAASPV